MIAYGAWSSLAHGFTMTIMSAQAVAHGMHRKLRVLRTPVPVSPEVCWFCERRASLDGYDTKVQMYCNEQGGVGMGGLHTWDEHRVSVPRCFACHRVHNAVRRGRLAGWLIGAVLIYFFLNVGRSPGDLTGMWLFPAWIALVPFLWLLSLPVLGWLGIKPTSKAQCSPYIRNYAISQKIGLLQYGSPSSTLLNIRRWMDRISGGAVR
jgi:hypothetical protein